MSVAGDYLSDANFLIVALSIFLAATIENLGIVSLENRYFLDTYKDSMFVVSM